MNERRASEREAPLAGLGSARRQGVSAQRKSRWLLGFSLVLAGVLLFLSFRGVHWEEMVGAIRRCTPAYLALAFLTISISYFARGLRWRLLLVRDRPVSPITAFWATMVGYVGNSFLPARAGDVLRPLAISRATGIRASYALATVVTERIIDTLALVVLSVVASRSLAAIPFWLNGATAIMASVSLLLIAGAALAPRLWPLLIHALGRVGLPNAFSERLDSVISTFILGMRALRRPRTALGFLVYTAVIWTLDILTALEMAWALHLPLLWQEALLLLVALGLGSAAPSTPGYVGIFQFVAVTVLVPFGISHSQAFAYILIFQAVTYGAVLIWGGGGGWRSLYPRQSGRGDEWAREQEAA